MSCLNAIYYYFKYLLVPKMAILVEFMKIIIHNFAIQIYFYK